MSAIHGPARQDGTSVFLSYSRRDQAFVVGLAAALSARGYDVIYDVSQEAKPDPEKSLTAQDEWWAQLQTMIAAADVMVLVVTPHSVASKECAREIAHARHCGRRIIPILRAAVVFEAAPEALRRLNVQIDFMHDDPAASETALGRLCGEIDTDIGWQREATRLSRRAHQWEADGCPESELLRQDAIDQAERLLMRRPRSAPDEFPALLAFLDASRRKEADDRRRLLTIIGRAYVKPARQALDEGYFDTSLRYAAAGALLGEDLSMALTPERESEGRFRLAAFQDRTRLVLRRRGERFDHIAFDARGERLAASACTGGSVYVWDIKTAKEILQPRSGGHDGAIRCIAISPDGESVLTTGADRLSTLSAVRGGLDATTFEGHGDEVLCGGFSPDGRRIVTGSRDKTACIWDVATGRRLHVLKGHEADVTSCRFSPDGKRVLTGSYDRTARIWNAVNGRPILRLSGHDGWVLAACWRPDGKAVATASADHTVQLWNAGTGKRMVRLEGHKRRVNGVSFSPDGKRIASASDDFTARIWDASSGTVMQILRGHINNVAAVSFSPDGRLIATASHDNTIRTWDASISPLVWRSAAVLGSARAAGCAFAADGVHIKTTNGDDIVLDQATGLPRSEPRTRKKAAAAAPPERPAVQSSDGRYLATIESWNAVAISDRETDETLRLDHGLDASVKLVCFSPDGARVLTGSRDGLARIWETTTTRLVSSTEADRYDIDGIGFSPDSGRYFTIGSEPFASIWDTESSALIARVGDSRPQAGAFSEDGRFLLLAAEDGRISLYDVARTQALAGPAASVLTAALANGKGGRPATEKRDLLLQDAPEDLHAGLLNTLMKDIDAAGAEALQAELQQRLDLLSAPLHPNCYSLA